MKNSKIIVMLFFTIISFTAHIHSSSQYSIPCLSRKIIVCSSQRKIASTILIEIELAEQSQIERSKLQSYTMQCRNFLMEHDIHSPEFDTKFKEINDLHIAVINGKYPCKSYATAKISPKISSSHVVEQTLSADELKSINNYLAQCHYNYRIDNKK